MHFVQQSARTLIYLSLRVALRTTFIHLVTLGFAAFAAHLRVEILGMVLEKSCDKINKPQAKDVCEIPQTLNLHHPHLGEVMGVTKVKFGTGGAAAPGGFLLSIEM
ncbi:hypothetical protein BK132_09285 [Paenibacillus sp. FSL H8-0259]|nr:hypothetical protein BK132_09285 [Paenibacillus sp. FSL H8-0259]